MKTPELVGIDDASSPTVDDDGALRGGEVKSVSPPSTTLPFQVERLLN